MSTFSKDWGAEETGGGRRHIVAGVSSWLISIGIHVALILLLARLTYLLTFKVEQPERPPRVEPMKLQDVRPEPVPVKPVVTPDRGGGGGSGGDAISSVIGSRIADKASTLSQPPREAIIEPPAVTDDKLTGELRTTAEPGIVPTQKRWQPRQDIIEIERKVVTDEIVGRGRREIPKIERVNKAPDIVFAADRDALGKRTEAKGGLPVNGDALALEDLLGNRIGGGPDRPLPPDKVKIDEPVTQKEIIKITSENPKTITPLKAIEKLLVAEITVYNGTLADRQHTYFKVAIKRAGKELLPVIHKDVLLIQDCSNSMDEQRLHFCRDGLTRCLQELSPNDRFNIVGFKEHSQPCFPDWVQPRPDTLAQAQQFIRDLKAGDNTDIFTSVKEQMNVKRTPGRPVVALLVSDGIPTEGMVVSSDIIGEFSKLNNGAISVFALGTLKTANKYLLDLVSYCNRGDSTIVTSGRWDIPDIMHGILRSVSRPVMSDMYFHHSASTDCEVYPGLPTNLYLDRPLVLYGRCPRENTSVALQAIGQAMDVKCDMVFKLDLEKNVRKGDKTLRMDWANQKIYHLIGQYARKQDPAVYQQLKATAEEYDIRLPYRKQL